jgi:hypothetical protein
MSKRKSSTAAVAVEAGDSSTAQPADGPIIRANVSREQTTAASYVSLYANDTQIQVSPWDVRLIFGEISQPATADRPTNVIKQTGEVRMSPQHAKVVAMILIAQLKQYEDTIGPIPIPK